MTILFIGTGLYAQDTPYTGTTTMEDYVELENPISVNNGEVWNSGSSYPIYFDFDFNIFDQDYSSLNIDAGGGIVFTGFGSKSIRVYHTPFGGYMLRDKGVDQSISSIGYEVIGEEGQHIIKIQWENAGFEQWYETSDVSDFIDLQVWIYQEDAHIELHFGASQTNPGTYGYPGSTSDSNPGPSIKFTFDNCSNVLSYYFAADNPSYNYFNMCDPTYSFIDGTPSEGITYIISPTGNQVNTSNGKFENISVFPNPVNDIVHVENITELMGSESVSVIDIYGRTLLEAQNMKITGTGFTLDLTTLPAGIYFLKIETKDDQFIRKVIKNGIH